MSAWSVDGEQLVHQSGKRIPARPKGLLHPLPDDAMPSRPRADAKERTFNLLIRDGIIDQERHAEERLIGRYPHDPSRAFAANADIAQEDRELFGEILDDHYVIEVKTTRFLFPFQSYLPGTFEFRGRYKMFTGKILAFLCQPAPDGGFNSELLDDFYELFNSKQGLTLLDATVLDIARSEAGDNAQRTASAAQLISRNYPEDPEGPGALLPAAHTRFQQDLATVLGMETMNRRDRINAAVSVFYVHLGLYFQRLGWLLEEEFAASLDALIDPTVQLARAESCFASGWEDSPFAGSIQFRVSTGQSRPVKMTDGAVTSYGEQNRRQLLIPANLSVLGAARQVMSACGETACVWTFASMVKACRRDARLAADFSEGLALMARETVADQAAQDRDDIDRQIAVGSPGLEVYREALMKTNRSALRRHGRDIVHQMVLRGGRGYLARRGRSIFFFEIGQDLLLLLAKVIAKDRQMPFRGFLDELRRYGFEAQSRQEQDGLAETLRALNLLEKHSDAGEAMYVKHFL